MPRAVLHYSHRMHRVRCQHSTDAERRSVITGESGSAEGAFTSLHPRAAATVESPRSASQAIRFARHRVIEPRHQRLTFGLISIRNSSQSHAGFARLRRRIVRRELLARYRFGSRELHSQYLNLHWTRRYRLGALARSTRSLSDYRRKTEHRPFDAVWRTRILHHYSTYG
jgi:hypothetical protein